MNFPIYIRDKAVGFGWICAHMLEKQPDSPIWLQLREITMRWVHLIRSDNPSIEEAEQVVADFQRFAEAGTEHVKRVHFIAEGWLDGLKGGEGLNPLKDFEEYWADPSNGRYALSSVGDNDYSIMFADDNGQLGDVTIEDDEIYEAVIQKMLEARVPVFYDISAMFEFAYRWKLRQGSK